MARDTMIFGENVQFSTDSQQTGLNNNVAIIGGSGSGKTMSFVEPRLLRTQDSSLIVTVTKRRIVDMYRPMFLSRGYEVLDMNFIHPEQSDVSYDPMTFIKTHGDIRFLAESLIKANPQKATSTKADPYWDDAAITLLCALIACVIEEKEKEQKTPSFADVMELYDKLNVIEYGSQIRTGLESRFQTLEQRRPSSYAAKCWKSFNMLPIRTASCVYGTLAVALDSIFTPELRQMIAMDRKVDLTAIGQKKTVLFVSTSAVNPALHHFINTFYGQIFKELFEFSQTQPDGTLPVPVQIICDDFATGSKVQNFPEYISVFRAAGISVMLLLQSESQLVSMYGSDGATTILNNCDTLVFTGSMDLLTNDSFSRRMNVPLDEVLYMPLGQVLVFRRGLRPIVTQRYRILEDKQYLAVQKFYRNQIERMAS